MRKLLSASLAALSLVLMLANLAGAQVASQVTVASTATSLFSAVGGATAVAIKNPGTADVFVGGTSAVTTSTGYKLSAGDTINVSLNNGQALYGIVATSTQVVYVLAAPGVVARAYVSPVSPAFTTPIITGESTYITGVTNTENAKLLSFKTGQLSGTEFAGLTLGAAANSGDPARGDIAFAIGWNVNSDGSTPRVSGEPSIMWRFENYYRPSSTACNTSTHGCQEAHLQWLTSDGTVRRPFGWQGIDNLKTSAMSFDGDVSFLSDDGNTQYWKFSSGSLLSFNSAAILFNNNVGVLKQLNSAGSRYNAVALYDNTDRLQLGDFAGNTNGVYILGHLGAQVRSFQPTPPTCTTNCGTSPAITNGTDFSGHIVMGASGSPASGFVVTFNGTWVRAPQCAVWMSKTGMAVGKMPIVVTSDTTTFTVTTNGTAPANSDTYDYRCTSN